MAECSQQIASYALSSLASDRQPLCDAGEDTGLGADDGCTVGAVQQFHVGTVAK